MHREELVIMIVRHWEITAEICVVQELLLLVGNNTRQIIVEVAYFYWR
jgi:hypothetical protein